MKSILCLCLLIGVWAQAEPFQDPFVQIQPEYFKMLDFRGGKSQTNSIPAFSLRMNKLADAEKMKLKKKELKTEAQKHRAGLIFIYDAMMTINNTNAVFENNLSFQDLKAVHHFAGSDAKPHDELAARTASAILELKLAQKLRPDDHRVESWIEAAKINLEAIQRGNVLESSLNQSLKVISVRPTFNLWTAIIVFSSQKVGTTPFDKLVTESKKFVDQSQKGKDPCLQFPLDCGNGPIAPYNLQAATVELGDVFVRQAEYLLSIGTTPAGLEMLSYARGTYNTLMIAKNAAGTKAWPDNKALNARIEYLQHLQPGKGVVAGNFQKISEYKIVYECASCHGRANSPNPYHFQASPWDSEKVLWAKSCSRALKMENIF